MDEDLYDLLGLAPNADREVIRAAIKAMLRKWHPDFNPGDPEGAHLRTASINRSAEILLNPESRARYDRTRSSRNPPTESKTRGISNPHPTPSSVDFGTLNPGQSSAISVSVLARGGSPADRELDKSEGRYWSLVPFEIEDGGLRLDFMIAIPPGTTPGPSRDSVRVTFDGNSVTIPLRWTVRPLAASETARSTGASVRPAAAPPRASSPTRPSVYDVRTGTPGAASPAGTFSRTRQRWVRSAMIGAVGGFVVGWLIVVIIAGTINGPTASMPNFRSLVGEFSPIAYILAPLGGGIGIYASARYAWRGVLIGVLLSVPVGFLSMFIGTVFLVASLHVVDPPVPALLSIVFASVIATILVSVAVSARRS